MTDKPLTVDLGKLSDDEVMNRLRYIDSSMVDISTEDGMDDHYTRLSEAFSKVYSEAKTRGLVGDGKIARDRTEADDTGQCPKCGEQESELVDTKSAGAFDHNEVCGNCIRKHGENIAREGERLQGQRPIGEQDAVDRATRCGSGWPR